MQTFSNDSFNFCLKDNYLKNKVKTTTEAVKMEHIKP